MSTIQKSLPVAGKPGGFHSKRFGDAMIYASRLHSTQFRKGPKPIPYISHLLGVASIVLEHGGDEDQAIAALLHDGPEDQGGKKVLNAIRRRFGDRVADMVAGCTDGVPVAKGQPKPPWQQRKEAYLHHLKTKATPEVLLISMADKLYNAQAILNDYRELGDAVWQRFSVPKDKTLWYYGNILSAYQQRNEHPRLLAQVTRTINDLLKEAGGNKPNTFSGVSSGQS